MNRYKLSRAGVDVKQGLKRLDNDSAFYEILLKKFCDSPQYEQLKNAMDQGDTQQAFQHAHTLKGASGNLSLVRIYDALTPMVEELRKGNLEMAQKYFEEVSEAYDVLMKVLKEKE